jgi:Xaa-Pro aminopeptidase
MILLQEYITRRELLASQLPKNSVAIIPAANETLRNGDVHYRFRQNSNFYYLTGYQEPDALLIIYANKEYVFFNREQSNKLELWTGKTLSSTDAITILGMHYAYSLSILKTKLPELLSNVELIYYNLNHYPELDHEILGLNKPINDLAVLINEMRVIKSSAEIELLTHVNNISIAAHQ